MKKLATVIAVAGLIGTPAFAADMAVKSAPPAPAPAPVYNWTGWYIGVNAGASMGKVNTDFNVAPATATATVFSPFATATFTTPPIGVSDTTSPDGFIGGGQIGYNWQYSPLIVVGLEADFQGALEKDNHTLTNNFSAPVEVCIEVCRIGETHGSGALDYSTKIDWFGTVRARLGYVWGNGEVVSYVTGGFAYGKVSIDGTSTPVTGGPPSITQAFSASHVNTGWVLGYGNEGHLPLMPGNWTWRVETLYMDLGHLDAGAPGGSASTTFFNAAGLPIASASLTTGPVSSNSHFTDWILRGGLNYRF